MAARINVDSRFWGDISGKARVFQVEGKNVGECLKQLVEKESSLKTSVFDGNGELTGLCFLTMNMAALCEHRLETPVKEGDIVGLIFGAGGCCY